MNFNKWPELVFNAHYIANDKRKLHWKWVKSVSSILYDDDDMAYTCSILTLIIGMRCLIFLN